MSEGAMTCSIRIFPTGFRAEAAKVVRILPPLIVATVSQWYIQPIAILFAGHLGRIELGAVGLACSLLNVLGNAIATGMAAACDASFAQAYGGPNKKMTGIHLQRCLFIATLSVIPCYAIHINIESLLLWVGQDPEIARLVGRYLMIHTPGTFSLFLNLVLQKYLQCQSIVHPDIWIGITAHGIHALLQYILLYQLNMGIEGSAIALATYYTWNLLLRVIYLNIDKNVQQAWGGWSWQCLNDWGPLGKIAVYGVVLMCAEWWSYELGFLLSGLLGAVQLAAQAVIFNLVMIIDAIPFGIAYATIILAGQYLGAGESLNAKTVSRVGASFVAIIGLFYLILMVSIPRKLVYAFTSDREVVDMVMSVMPILVVFAFINGHMVLSRYMFRVVAKQKEATVIVFGCFFLLGMPIGYCLMFLTPLGISGAWLGFLICVGLSAIIMSTRYLCFFNWEALSVEAMERACGISERDDKKLLSKEASVPYGSLEESEQQQCISEKDSNAFSAAKTEDKPITREEIIQKVFIILGFLGILILAVVARLLTAGFVATRRVIDIESNLNNTLLNITNVNINTTFSNVSNTTIV